MIKVNWQTLQNRFNFNEQDLDLDRVEHEFESGNLGVTFEAYFKTEHGGASDEYGNLEPLKTTVLQRVEECYVWNEEGLTKDLIVEL